MHGPLNVKKLLHVIYSTLYRSGLVGSS